MKIKISQEDGGTSLQLNGSEIGNCVSEFTLTQKAGDIAVLTVKIYADDGLEIDLADGAVLFEKEVIE